MFYLNFSYYIFIQIITILKFTKARQILKYEISSLVYQKVFIFDYRNSLFIQNIDRNKNAKPIPKKKY